MNALRTIAQGRWFAALAVALAVVVCGVAHADPVPALPGDASPAGLVGPLRILGLLTLLSLLPAIVLTTTSFTRTVVVLSFVRVGIGTQQAPPTQVLVGLSLFMTLFVMSPVTTTLARDVYTPYTAGQITEAQAVERAVTPLRAFMLRQTREQDLAMFYEATGTTRPRTEEDVPMTIATPAFVVSELTTAFQMGVLVLLPFLVIDLVVSALLMSMGMMMVPPSTLSLPLKLMVFVVADGWHLLVGSLLRSFGT